jgi:hypothetical protein
MRKGLKGRGLQIRFEVFMAMTMKSQSQSHFATDGRSVSMSWCRAPSGAMKNAVFGVINIQFVSHRKLITSELQRPAS